MIEMQHAVSASTSKAHGHSEGVFLRSTVIGLTAFLTVVDLFATQAILPSLARHYGVAPAAIGFAVNACTLGMAVSGLTVGYFSREIDRRKGILISLVLLSIPTALLATAPNLTVFTVLRVAQGLCMASAFTLTLAYLGEHYSAADSASAFAAYITGNVASNLIGRLISAAFADHFGLAANFYFFAALNLLGGVLVHFTVERTPCMQCVTPAMSSHFQAWIMHLKNPSLRASFAIGFCILFAFIGTFTYVNFVLVQPPLGVGAKTLGFIYFVFLPSIVTTPLAGPAVRRFGTRPTFWGSLLVAALGLPLLILPSLWAVLVGMVLVGVGTFFAQACATGFVGRAALSDRGSASGLYLASYFFGSLVGSAVLGVIFDMFGWAACVAGIAVALFIASVLAIFLHTPMAPNICGRIDDGHSEFGFDRCLRRVDLLGLAEAVKNHGRARRSERSRDAEPDSAGRASYQGHLAIKPWSGRNLVLIHGDIHESVTPG
jgi:MFS transporter, YNFM family, putative membrane transport protein